MKVSNRRTQQSCKDDQPRPNIRQCFDDLLLLQPLVLRPALLIANPLDCGNTFLLRQHSRVRRGVGHEQEHGDPNRNGECAQHEVDDLERCKFLIRNERDALAQMKLGTVGITEELQTYVGEKSAKYPRNAILTVNSVLEGEEKF